MKRLFALLLSSLMICAFILAGCGNNAKPAEEAPTEAATEAAPETAAPEAPETAAPETAAPETAAPETAAPEAPAEETSEAEAADTPMTGGWTVVADQPSALTPEETERFETAMADLLGVNYEPVDILATQIVSGTNYAYLCKGTVVAPDAQPSWYIATIYEDLNGEVKCLAVKEVDVANPAVITEYRGDVMGGWEVKRPGEKPFALSDEAAQAAFEKGAEAAEMMNYYPIAVVGTQVVAGTNYKILCVGMPVKPDPDKSLYFVTVYADLEGNATLENAFELDLNYYTDYSEEE